MSLFRKKAPAPQVVPSIGDELKNIYQTKLLPLEKAYNFHEFVSPALTDPDFDAKPMILLVGQYSTGKTSFIKYLLEQDYPGMRIGPEPTTDAFNVVMYGEQDQIIPGNVLAVDTKRPFCPLMQFGSTFLNRFQCSTLKNPILKNVTLVDTPGILAGEKQRVDRGYDFVAVLQWFAERVDRIILLFDANKLDISDEFRRSIQALDGYQDKVRIVLNKADQIDRQELMRCYGALMWSITKVIHDAECPRVYIGSFWDKQLKNDFYKRLFDKEFKDFMKDIQSLHKFVPMRQINDMIRRARMAKNHAYVISTLKGGMPRWFNKTERKNKLIKELPDLVKAIQDKHLTCETDFPLVHVMQLQLANYDFTKFPNLLEGLMQAVDKMIQKDIAVLLERIQQELHQTSVKPGVLKTEDASLNFEHSRSREATPITTEGMDYGVGEGVWVVNKDRAQWDVIFQCLNPIDGKIRGQDARKEMGKSKLPNTILSKIWQLADTDKDGALDCDEFALAMYLINLKLDDYDIPDVLPFHLIPPSKNQSREKHVRINESNIERETEL